MKKALCIKCGGSTEKDSRGRTRKFCHWCFRCKTIKKCITCGVIFVVKHHRPVSAQYCSRDCHRKSQRASIAAAITKWSCAYCGCRANVTTREFRSRMPQYCSSECRAKGLEKYPKEERRARLNLSSFLGIRDRQQIPQKLVNLKMLQMELNDAMKGTNNV